MFYLTETNRDGAYMTGDILFTSETNNVDVKFKSDESITDSGFTLDVRSIPCSDRAIYPQVEDEEPGDPCDDSIAQEVMIAAGEVIEDALITVTESGGNYSNSACQDWNIMAEENQVQFVFQRK